MTTQPPDSKYSGLISEAEHYSELRRIVKEVKDEYWQRGVTFGAVWTSVVFLSGIGIYAYFN